MYDYRTEVFSQFCGMLSFDTARSIASMLGRRGVNSIAVRADDAQGFSNLDKAFEILRLRSAKSWHEIAESLGTQKSQSTMRTLRRLNERLLHNVLLGDSEVLGGNPRHRARITCYRDLMVASMLLNSSHNKAAFELTEQTSKKASQWQITTAELLALKFLRRRAATKGDRAWINDIERRLKLCMRIAQAEDEAEAMEDATRMSTHNARRNSQTFDKDCKDRLQRLSHLLKKYDRFAIRLAYWRISLWHSQVMLLHADGLATANAATKWLTLHSRFSTSAYLGEFDAARMSACLQLRDYKSSVKAWKQYSSRAKVGSVNWSIVLQLHFLTCCITGKLEDAADAYLLYARNIPSSIDVWRRQRWNLFKAYLEFIMDQGYMKRRDDVEFLRHTYPSNLMKASAQLIQNKVSDNSSIQILKILHQLRVKKYSEIIAATESLRTYSSKYLRIPELKRTSLFLKCLHMLTAADFDPELWHKRTIDIRSQLSDEAGRVIDDAEIMPYPFLYDVVLDILNTNSSTRTRRR